MKIIPKKEDRGIGDNSLQLGEWAAAAVNDAIAYTAKIIKKNVRLEDRLNKAIYGKNSRQRDVALSEAQKINASVVAILGAIMPEPFAIPHILISLFHSLHSS